MDETTTAPQEVIDAFSKALLVESENDFTQMRKTLLSMRITSISIMDGGEVLIRLHHPGILIGPRGTRINKISEVMGVDIRIQEEDETDINTLILLSAHQQYEIEF